MGGAPAFHRDVPRRRPSSAAPRGTRRGTGLGGEPVTVVRGFLVDSRHCACAQEVQDNIDWVTHEIGNYRACRREVGGGSAKEIKTCKDRRNTEAGIETESLETVSMTGEVEEAALEGACGAIINHGVNKVHVPVHLRSTDRLEKRDKDEPSGRAFATNEIKAHRRERAYLRKVRKAIDRQCGE